MSVPTSFSDLSTTAASNSPAGSETPAEGDNHFRITYAFLRSIMDNSGNGWVSPYWALAASGVTISATAVTWSGNPTHSGNHTFSGNLTVQGNSTLGNAGTDTITLDGGVNIKSTNKLSFTNTIDQTYVYAPSSNVLAFGSNSVDVAQVYSGGFQIKSTNKLSFTNTADQTYIYASATNTLAFGTNSTDRLTLTSDGRFYGTALHNNAGSVTGTTNQYIASSDNTTPTITSITNLTGTPTATYESFVRVGNKVTVTGVLGGVNVTTPGSGATVQITTPMNMAGSQTLARLVGKIWDSGTTTGQAIAWVSATQLQLSWTTSTAGSHSCEYEYSYIVG